MGAPPAGATDSVLAVVHDLLWAHALPSDGLEHITSRRAEQGLRVFLFLQAPSDAAALLSARAVLDRSRSPLQSLGYVLGDLPD
ncbi:hypothetical protein [Streptomyces sp. NBC_00503]|uniref:hypothetical protein n=1 Tax=Streptomyces sp. NBC_00503 TaxID=2903659 RepID=UPI002E8078D1|nr:hypothetical protein [Streptomyces sp. NBC_00503]WUD83735.1 hypothetical protein OG490_26040 [Streptomyces sp. NBC_00503]